MRLADLLGAGVVDATGESVGRVYDVLVRRRPAPVVATQGIATLHVAALVVGRRGLGSRLGYAQGVVTGPWLLAVLVRRLTGHLRVAEWADVTEVADGVVRLRRRSAELRPLVTSSGRPETPS